LESKKHGMAKSFDHGLMVNGDFSKTNAIARKKAV